MRIADQIWSDLRVRVMALTLIRTGSLQMVYSGVCTEMQPLRIMSRAPLAKYSKNSSVSGERVGMVQVA
jgi:hypothetical protein